MLRAGAPRAATAPPPVLSRKEAAMTILVAYVARPEGEAALEKGIEIATRRNEPLVVVNAGPGGRDNTGIVDGFQGERMNERLAALPVPAEFKHFVRGKGTVEEIENLVTQLPASLLVIGLRKRSAVGKLLLGSTAQELLLTASCPVLAVKAG
jgi:nucleotide-binding universal stress UspA family protein